ncbi:NUDIX domain-containing protein [Paenibacillus sp. sptzw28]|uniref:NUDIX domain-containing protein n=1 Tax=Paenibacillus sp. sptzw28 TaxID=715179 RepID=UPI001C6DDA34|nr:NUDIX domain-containing protein [Paenibacillus sp. sptzw28]QYR23473.1 NUDIX domain-containing protein [Paenibacillus sp. sptzw28]
MKMRSSVCALIIRDNHVLTIKKHDKDISEYILPGGGQEFGETLADALRREVREEVGASINNIRLLFVREYIGKNHEHSIRDKEIHVISHIFTCDLDEEGKYPLEPDDDQVGMEWINIEELKDYNFYPKELIKLLKKDNLENPKEIYIGDIN